ncbi:YqaE/Pmp3 family membrane protein [Oscillatoria sp. FACHB-1406]|uniref:YqaE/Pmp3 family membrane protein n=1 Tax=Oscillatoria sp. FACHB-1406 TaxID=2692846 RepID=UPI0016864E49|nr:YqaE/Pmp3 family membrane protein [Oscillatoria sp. FACHB-1406]MBD2577542.1 YqaE/Pmp3 family membrane protein [Oscillatoria sp. FACHB-1406]
MNLLRVLLAVLVPPLGVFLTAGVSTALIINILLTLLGWLPGSIHAVWVLSKYAERAGEQERTY